ncbi:TatD family hydrolase [Clostridium grantii]|uniref:TatD DNase family protein n=1 Tax=Clostridium grantii DSM 8605 TaxID=1121316 RepID=A0A1M5XU71_9CLOT|nr:TatD family hydrolase [Clostridium grantii]SHI03306.1 TatD DNase family protein [Clostridium grantii DSM 8605]
MIFDTHAHYDDERFDEDRETVITELRENGVAAVLNCGSSLKGTLASLKLSEEHNFFYAAIGIHPECANEFDEEVYNQLKKMALDTKVKAIGEIGLDYYWEENPSKDIQIKVMRKQMELARELNLPVVIHDREAHEDVLNIIKDYPEVRGVIHSFSGSVEFAKECLKQGYYIGFTGVVTFKNAKKIKNVAKEIPLNRILVETDCPYMTPEPHRGKRNRSDYIPNIIKTIAELRAVSFKDIEEASIKNAQELFDIKLSS